MGSQQGDDLQLNGDLACENAEIRSSLTVGGVPVTPGGGAFQIVVYQPAIAASSAPYYKTWAEVEAVINALDGACQLWVDQTGLGGFAQVPATANLDGKGRLEIIGKGPQGEAELQMADGAQIKNVQTWRTIVVRGNGNAAVPLVWDIDGMIVECFDATFLFDAVTALPVMQLAPSISYISFFFTDSSELRNSHNPGAAVLDLGTNPGALCLLSIDTLFFPSSFVDTISGIVGQTLQLQTDSSVGAVTLAAFAGTLTRTNIDQAAGATVGLGPYPDIVDTPGVSVVISVEAGVSRILPGPGPHTIFSAGDNFGGGGGFFQQAASSGTFGVSAPLALHDQMMSSSIQSIGALGAGNNNDLPQPLFMSTCEPIAAGAVITGFNASNLGPVLPALVFVTVVNQSTVFPVTLRNEDGGSLPDNRLRTAAGLDLVIRPGGAWTMTRMGVSGLGRRWYIVGANP